MKRRIFIGSSLVPLFLPDLTLAGALPSANTPAHLYFDSRFSIARKFAANWIDSDRWQAVQADITPVWNSQLKHKRNDGSFHAAGVTTESFFFCLQTLLQPTHQVSTEITRVNQDLYAWTMTANNKNNRSLS